MVTQADLLLQCLQQIEQRRDAFMASIYERLFLLYPEITHYFANACMEEQQHKLLMFLVFVLENLDKPDYLAAALQRLGRLHSHYHIQIEHFKQVGVVFLDAFAEQLGPAWTPCHHAAWIDTYHQMITMMLKGYTIPKSTSAGQSLQS